MMDELTIGLIVGWLLLVGLMFLLSHLPERPKRLPEPPPPAAIPLRLESAERMVERAYERSPSRRMSGGESQRA
jgi:hypothetical protein